jgi:hypothetical protein
MVEIQNIARYIQGYREQPETEDEIAMAEALSVVVFSGEPWVMKGGEVE